MAKKSKLNQVAAKIGGALGKADRKAHQVVRAGTLAKKELQDITKQVDALKRQLAKTSKRLKHALELESKSPNPISKTTTNSRMYHASVLACPCSF